MPSKKIYLNHDILVFCETFLKEDENFDIKDFYGYHRPAQFINKRWRRGISCFLKPHLGTFSHLELTDEALIIILDTITILCCYFPPAMSAADFESSLFDALQFIPADTNLLVLGDFNARIDSSSLKCTNSKTEVLTRVLEALNLTLANEPSDLTFISGNGNSTIDLIFFDQHYMTLNFCHTTENIDNCKHIPVKAKFTLKNVPDAPQDAELKPVYRVDEDLFVHNFRTNFTALNTLLDDNQIDEAYDKILHLIRLSEGKGQLSQRTAQP